jgi:hypothetical protein
MFDGFVCDWLFLRLNLTSPTTFDLNFSKWRNKQGRPLKNDKKRFTTSYFKMLQTKPSKNSSEKRNIILHVDSSNLTPQTSSSSQTLQTNSQTTNPSTMNLQTTNPSSINPPQTTNHQTTIPPQAIPPQTITSVEHKPIFRPVKLSEKDMMFVYAFYENPISVIVVSVKYFNSCSRLGKMVIILKSIKNLNP